MGGWFEEQRLSWIVEMMWVYGFIRRDHLMRKFGISQPQASKDLQSVLRQRPGLMHYDVSRKAYVARAKR